MAVVPVAGARPTLVAECHHRSRGPSSEGGIAGKAVVQSTKNDEQHRSAGER